MAASKEEKQSLKIVYKNIDDLIPTEYNPKSLSPKEENGIRDSIKKFGLVDPIVVNVHPDRMNIIVGGHQRTRIAKSLGYEEMPCVEVSLPIDKEKELNVRLSKNTASIDSALLALHFDREMLFDIGFLESELTATKSEFQEEFEKYDNSNCVHPIVPRFSEKHGAVIILFDNETDEVYLETVLGIGKMQSYKNQAVGKTSIISVEQFKNAIENQ